MEGSPSRSHWIDPSISGALPCLSLTEPVAQTVGRDDVEHLPRAVAALFDVEFGELLVQSVSLELCEQRFELLHMERTTVLGWIAAIFCESDLDLIAGKHRRVVRRVAARQHPEAEHSLVERQSRGKVAHGKT